MKEICFHIYVSIVKQGREEIKMKEIGVVTFHKAYNYGAKLQALALQYFLNTNGFNSTIIDYRCNSIEDGYKIVSKNLSLKNNFKKIYYFVRNPKILIKHKNFDMFDKKYLKVGKVYKNKNDLKKRYPQMDIYITGSDQVWNPKLTSGLDDIYTLNFGNKQTKRISYAASTGTPEIIKKYKDDFKKKLTNIDYISVRENDCAIELERTVGKKVFNAIDPTLLIDADAWNKIIENKDKVMKKKYILAYAPGNENYLYYKSIEKIAKLTNLPVVHFRPFDNRIKAKKISKYSSGPSQFIDLIKNAEFVITTSFHGVAFSAIYNKKLFIILSSYPNRLLNLIDKLNLSTLIVKDINDIEINQIERIDWSISNSNLKKEREKSIEWLINSINGEINE